MKTALLTKFFLLFCFFASAQHDSITAIFKSKKEFAQTEFRGVDKYQNTYLSEDDVFFKNSEDEEYHFSAPQLGQLTSVDLLNPLRITLFYRDVNTVVVLDDQLNEMNRISFNAPDFFRTIGFATTCLNQSLWIFNLDRQQLERFDYIDKRKLSQSAPLDEDIKAQESNFNFCWLLGEEHLMKFNSYGSVLASYPAENITAFTQDNDRVIVLKENTLHLKPKNSENFKPVKGLKKHIEKFYLSDENLYLYDGDKVFHYQLKLPN